MKIGFGKFWIEFDLSGKIIKNNIDGFFKRIENTLIPREFKICEIDGRYAKTKYIDNFYSIKCTKKKLEELINTNDLKNKKYFIAGSDSGELTGYEGYTLDDFDVVVDFG